MKLPFTVLLGGWLLWGCGAPEDARTPLDAAATENGGRHALQSDTERALVERAAVLPVGVKEKIGTHTVSASEPYRAASGFTCRRLFLEGPSELEIRLACGDDEGWFFVPDVYRDERPLQPEPQAEVRLSPHGEATVVDSPSLQPASPSSNDGEDTVPEQAGP